MAFEVETFSRQQMLARMVQMKLQQLVTRSGNDAGAARIGIELNGVAIVDEPQRQRLVIIVDRTDVAFDAIAEVDGGLLQAQLACLEIGSQLSPFFGSAVAFITPVRLRGAARCRLV